MQDVDEQDAPRRDTGCAGCLAVQELAYDQCRCAYDASNARRVDDRQRQDHVDNRRAQHGDERDSEQDVGKRHHRVDNAHDRSVETAEEPGNESKQHTGRHGDRDHDRSDHQRIAGAIDDSREHVASEGIRAQPMVDRRSSQTDRQVLRPRILRRDEVAEDRHDSNPGDRE